MGPVYRNIQSKRIGAAGYSLDVGMNIEPNSLVLEHTR